VSTPPPPPDDGLEATVATPRVQAPPPPPPLRRIEPAVVEPREPVRVSPAAAAAAPSYTIVAEPSRYDFGHPVGYVFARLFAFVFDVALISVVVTSLAYSMIAINPITGLPTNSQRGFDATLALGIAFALVYVWVGEAFLGTTIGKLAMGLHVYAQRGGSVGLGRALVRMLLRPLDALIVGGVLALLPGHRRLGDLAAGTVVARSRMRGFAPLLGWVAALVVGGLPFILAGTPRTFASLVAFWQFLPGLGARLVLLAQTLLHLVHLA
jgi:uncharacterized RDD family membrane protein YckC